MRADNPDMPGDHPDQPGNWTDYRVSVYLRSVDNDAIGVVFRYCDPDNFYRFSMDRERKYRRLVKVTKGVPANLAEDDFVYRQGQDYLVTVEAIGSSLRVFQNGGLIFDVTDGSFNRGRIGLYCWGHVDAHFSEIRVDDFRTGAPVVYRFQFTTSQFTNFFHHLHSFQDEAWVTDLAEVQIASNGRRGRWLARRCDRAIVCRKRTFATGGKCLRSVGRVHSGISSAPESTPSPGDPDRAGR